MLEQKDLFHGVLLNPSTRPGINRLLIVSGFATAGMADRHMEHLQKMSKAISIELIVGMTRRSGIEKAQHYAFRKMAKECPYGMDFSCRYVGRGNPVHAKTYCWMKGDEPCVAFVGSANYTLTAFGREQIESVVEADQRGVMSFHRETRRNTVDCNDEDIEQKIALTETRSAEDDDDSESVTLSLLDKRTGDPPAKSGINWGQRPNRDPNEAYINIPANIGRSGFFPERSEQFTVLTDDGDSFIMVRAQDAGKGIETTQNNSLLGRYLRTRIGVKSGEYVTRQHLVEYGRTNVTFRKIDEETYEMDFRPNMGPGEDAEGWQK